MRTKLKITEGIFPMPVLMVATYNEDGSVNVTAAENVMVDGKIDMSKVNAIAFDPYTHGYYKVTERVGEAFRDGLKLKKYGMQKRSFRISEGSFLKYHKF